MDNSPSPNQLALSGPSRPEPEAPEEPQAQAQDREYGCKYCTKKFSNKQALGGHYNAHKLERTLEKTARELHDNRFNYYVANGAGYNRGRYLGSYNRSHQDLVDRSVYNNFPYRAHQQLGMHIGNNARPGMMFPGNTYGLARPSPFPGWAAPRPRVHQFPGQGPRYVGNQGMNVRFPNVGMGGASSSSRPVQPDLSTFAVQRNRDAMSGSGNRGRDEDESGLDLSLRL
ncbi:hypothetical protein CASFOL_025582 [Castilleja foliolosa]|uniref:C2H2-type domain-containing protein n=1 Tax=Castilleja foliolosa TaxID=1961234 RepID=A0ABD3CSF2_9LAMI